MILNGHWVLCCRSRWFAGFLWFLFLGRRFVDHHVSYAGDCSPHHVDPHVPVLPGVHELAADADVGAAEEDHSCRHQGPEHQELLRSLRCEVHHHELVVVLVVVAVVRHLVGVVGSVATILGVEVHALHAEGVDTTLHVLEDLDVVEDGDVLLQGDHAHILPGLPLDEPVPVLPGLGVLLGQVTVVGPAQVPQPGPVGAVRPVDCVHFPINSEENMTSIVVIEELLFEGKCPTDLILEQVAANHLQSGLTELWIGSFSTVSLM